MSAPIALVDGLAFVSVTLRANGQSLLLERVLLDTGSGGMLFKTDDLEQLGIIPLPSDPLRIMRGIGGEEAVIEKRITALEVGPLVVAPLAIQLGAVDYDIAMDGILGLDYLLRAHATIDFGAMQLRLS